MHLIERDKWNKNEILIARFDNYTEAQHAQQILKDFGYSRDAVKVVELSYIARRMGNARTSGQQTINRVMRVIVLSAILICIAFVTFAYLLGSVFSLPELGMVVLVWITLISAGVVICCFIGAMVWKLINSKAMDWGLEAVKRGKILISVKLQNPDDAIEIEQAWREIGGEVV
jgi:hypothetical protein